MMVMLAGYAGIEAGWICWMAGYILYAGFMSVYEYYAE
jgi:hypothetical protein